MNSVTVVIPAYNASSYLARCLASVVSQKNLAEIIVVNDGSTDDTVKIAKAFDTRIIDSQINKGIGYSRQRGAEAAETDHIAFLSADDAYCPNFMEKIEKCLDGEAAVFTDYFRCDGKLQPKTLFSAPKYSTQEELKQLVISWALRKNMFVNFSTVVLPRKIFAQVKFRTEMRRGEDLIFLLESVIKNIRWLHVREPLCLYRISNYKETVLSWYALWETQFPLLQQLGVSDLEYEKAKSVSFKVCFPSCQTRLRRWLSRKRGWLKSMRLMEVRT